MFLCNIVTGWVIIKVGKLFIFLYKYIIRIYKKILIANFNNFNR